MTCASVVYPCAATAWTVPIVVGVAYWLPVISAYWGAVALALSYLLPLRLWQRALWPAIVAAMAITRSITPQCQVPGPLARR